jgi:hypothetical protein
MAGFLDGYGVEEERRGRIVRRIAIAVVSTAVLALVLYFTLRTYPAKRAVREFLEDLRKHDYQAAYLVWGCRALCPDYPYGKFIEDWGPRGDFRNPDALGIAKTEFCHNGVIVTLGGKGHEVPLWYERDTKALGFAPWPVCAERIPAPTVGP